MINDQPRPSDSRSLTFLLPYITCWPLFLTQFPRLIIGSARVHVRSGNCRRLSRHAYLNASAVYIRIEITQVIFKRQEARLLFLSFFNMLTFLTFFVRLFAIFKIGLRGMRFARLIIPNIRAFKVSLSASRRSF